MQKWMTGSEKPDENAPDLGIIDLRNFRRTDPMRSGIDSWLVPDSEIN